MNYYLLLGLLNLVSCLSANPVDKNQKINVTEPVADKTKLGQLVNNSTPTSTISSTLKPNDKSTATVLPSGSAVTSTTSTAKPAFSNDTQKVTTVPTVAVNNGSITATTPTKAPTSSTTITTTTTTTATTNSTNSPTVTTASSSIITSKPTKPSNGTPTAAPHRDRRFDGPSFIGGMILTLGFVAIGFVSFKFYKARTELNYHTL